MFQCGHVHTHRHMHQEKTANTGLGVGSDATRWVCTLHNPDQLQQWFSAVHLFPQQLLGNTPCTPPHHFLHKHPLRLNKEDRKELHSTEKPPWEIRCHACKKPKVAMTPTSIVRPVPPQGTRAVGIEQVVLGTLVQHARREAHSTACPRR